MGLLYRFCFLQSRKPSDSDLRFKEIIAFIDENYQNDLSCRSLSRKFGYDEAYFSRKFKDITGLSPTVYIRILRLEYAQKLLKKGISVAEAARQSGFSDAGYFSPLFQKTVCHDADRIYNELKKGCRLMLVLPAKLPGNPFGSIFFHRKYVKNRHIIINKSFKDQIIGNFL